jgi:hypothetical protein
MEIKVIDSLSPKPHLFIKDQIRYKSNTGAILTLIAFISTLVLSLYFLIAYIQKKDLNIIWYKEGKDFQPVIDLNNKLFAVRFRDTYLKPLDPRIASIQVTYWHMLNNTRSIQYLPLELCGQSKLFPDLDYSTFQCLKPDVGTNLTIWADPLNQRRAFINIYLVTCKNSTENNNFCYSQTEIETRLKSLNMFFDYYISKSTIDHYDSENPLQDGFYLNTFKITYDFFYTYYEYLKEVIYVTDNGKVFEDLNTYTGFEYDENTSFNVPSLIQSTKTIIDGSFTIIQILSNERYADKYRRTYPKLQSVVASIGGVIELIWFCGRMICELITPAMMYLDIAHNFVDFSKSCDKSPKKNLTVFSHISGIKLSSCSIVNSDPYLYPKKEISFIDSVIPTRFTSKMSTRRVSDKCKELITKKMSIEYIIKSLNDFERMKQIIFEESQIKLFDNLPNLKLDEQFNKKILKNTDISHIIAIMNDNEPVNKRLKEFFK